MTGRPGTTMSTVDVRAALARNAWTVPATLALAILLWAGVGAMVRAHWVTDTRTRWFLPTAGSGFAAIVLAVLAAVAVACYVRPRRTEFSGAGGRGTASLSFLLVAVLAGVGAVCGIMSYLPCEGDGVPGLNALTWTATLFAGGFESAAIGPDASIAVCAGPVPFALQVARFAAIAATFISAVTALLVVFRGAIARWTLRFARRLDIVVGLDELSLPLIRALLRERARAGDDDGFRPRRERRRDLRSTRVVVVHPTRTDPLVVEAAAAGAAIVVGNLNTRLLRSLITPRWRRPSPLRRLYLVSPDQRRNLRMLREAERALAELSGFNAAATTGVIPRVVVRLEDAQEARAWRLAQADTTNAFIDAITVDDLLADVVANRILDTPVHSVMLVGDTALTVRLIDELVWRRWKAKTLADHTDRRAPEIVLVAGDRAGVVVDAWSAEHRAPIDIELRAVSGDWEDAVASQLDDGTGRALVLTLSDSASAARAARVARSRPALTVLARDETVFGMSDLGDGSDVPALVRFGPSLVESGLPPEDSWTKLARLQHLRWAPTTAWVAAATDDDLWQITASQRPWGGAGDDDLRARRSDVTTDALHRLPDFHREDNLRQQRRLLTAVTASGLRWVPTSRIDKADSLRIDELITLARIEHERWADERLRNGWSGVDIAANTKPDLIALERARLNLHLRDWSSGEPLGPRDVTLALDAAVRRAMVRRTRAGNVSAIVTMLDALAHFGIAPTRDGHQATLPADAVHAWIEHDTRTAHVLAPSGAMTDMSLADFADNHRHVVDTFYLPVGGVDPGWRRFRRTGTVTATVLTEALTWQNDEGATMRSEAGDWWVSSRDGGERGVAAHRFPALYEPLEGDSYRRLGGVDAYRVTTAGTLVLTLEGLSPARIGDWIVRDDRGDMWPVPDDAFTSSYAHQEG